MLRLAIGPKMVVIGAAITLINGMLEDQVRLNPDGAQNAVVKNGLRLLAIACGHQTRYQLISDGSAPSPM
jgi:hypothetical protein